MLNQILQGHRQTAVIEPKKGLMSRLIVDWSTPIWEAISVSVIDWTSIDATCFLRRSTAMLPLLVTLKN